VRQKYEREQIADIAIAHGLGIASA